MLRQSDQDRLDFHFTVSGMNLTHSEQDWGVVAGRSERRWTQAIAHTQISTPPEDVTRTAGWTYGDLTAANSTYIAVLGSYATYLDVSRNTRRAGL
jgi:hypothetical protein